MSAFYPKATVIMMMTVSQVPAGKFQWTTYPNQNSQAHLYLAVSRRNSLDSVLKSNAKILAKVISQLRINTL